MLGEALSNSGGVNWTHQWWCKLEEGQSDSCMSRGKPGKGKKKKNI